MDEENPHPVFWDDMPGGEEEKVEEAEDDYAPLQPEMIAASYEAAKPRFIEDNDNASVPPEQIASPFVGHGDEEDEPEKAEDDCAPLPPEMIAASFEAAKPKLIEDNDDASVPLKQIVKDTTLLMFIVIAFLFHMSNRAVPPLVTKTLAIGDVRTSILMSCLCIIAVQIFTVGPLWVTYSNSGVVMVMAIAYTMIFALYPSTNSLVKNLRPVKYNKMKMLKQSSTLISIIALSEVLVCVRSQVQQVSLQSVF